LTGITARPSAARVLALPFVPETIATLELAVCYLSMNHKGVRYEVLQALHPAGWKWVAHISSTRQTTGFSSEKEIAIRAAKRAIEKVLEEAEDK
jgi:hypothetical protein